MGQYWLRYRGTRFPLRRGETLLGRSPYCSIVLGNPLASREHCALMLDDAGLSIKDLGSSNGTLVNGERVATRSLADGDVIRIGAEMLEVVVADPQPQRAGSSTAKSLEGSEGDTASFDFDRSSGPVDLDSIAFIEQLVASAAETGHPAAMGKPIQMAIDGLLASVRGEGTTLDRPTAIRVAAVVEKMAPWYPTGELEAWRRDVLAALKLGDP